MRALITGGAGFIGSHLADALVGVGHEVIVLDDLSTGLLENVAHLLSRRGIRFHRGDATDYNTVDDLVREADHVFHLAAVVGVYRVLGSPRRMLASNHRMTANVLESAARHGKRVF